MANEQAEERSHLSVFQLLTAIAVLIAFGVLVAIMIGRTGVEEPQWTRLAWVFSSVEALAFGAAGALFGSSIQRDRAVAAEKTARENADAASENAEDALKGKALAAAVRAGTAGTDPDTGMLGDGSKPQPGLAALRAMADELFPA